MTDRDAFLNMAAALRRHRPIEVNDPARARAAVALIHAPASTYAPAQSDRRPELLVIKRATRDGDPWSGQMALPGGRYQPEDGSLLTTARRESLEETGISLEESHCLGVLSDLAPDTPISPPVSVRPFVFALSEKPDVALNHEAVRYLWAPLDTLRSSHGRARVEVQGHHLLVDAFLIDGEVIWGMTQRIIMPFLDLANI